MESAAREACRRRCEEEQRGSRARGPEGLVPRRAGTLDAAPARTETQGHGEDRSAEATHEGTGPGARVGSGGTRLGSQESDLKTGFWKQNPQTDPLANLMKQKRKYKCSK